ncbi:MAG: LPXTG cell wall anchor domain-containing protein [Ilumatobacteraceae bacterium]
MKLFQLIAAAGITAATLVGLGGIASASAMASTAGVACVNGDGVVDLAISNPATDAGAEFVITNPETLVASVVELDPGASQVIVLDGLSDGRVIVPVKFNGSDASVSTVIACDPLACATGVLTTVVDDSGVQQQACVDSASAAPAGAAVAPAAATSARSLLAPPQSTTTTSPQHLPKTGTGTGGLVIAALLVGSGSVASLLSRRKP